MISKPSIVRAITMTPDIKTPTTTAGQLRLMSLMKSQASRVPVQAPVIGRGMATKSTMPINPYLSIIFCLRFRMPSTNLRTQSHRVEKKPGERLKTMKHVKTVSRVPARAADIPVDTKLTFIVNILNAFKPILQAKEPQQ